MSVEANKPLEHMQDAQKLTADGYVNLYEIQLKTEPVILRLTDSVSRKWQGQDWEMFGVQISGEKRSADGEETRPQLQFINPEGVFSTLVRQRLLDRATVIRYRLLREHYEGDVQIYQRRMWWISRISNVTAGQTIAAELRVMTEGPNSRIPARQFIPPEFPMVRLG
ncbi:MULTISPECIES: hypothetical protein [unclassified Mesorhizobium]|uniref:hypothetical protein n=1 Tax=unclassified Mesorhizobium TaxID=325217 RepID=UPI000FD93A51|nr:MULTISPECIES: hypothetical protein [unclassified Mesorhizobium]TGT64095.1 hypothetical protein EN809_035145 [Mesorhizobium sp. M2E.F.Ca.ET.166.01.1.1]TGV97022.1 hypothetical protein EN797_035020 [Mesorhizobium sp. M2E.F.Ca.ET.154.01.1.1]